MTDATADRQAGAEIRGLVRRCDRAALATVTPAAEGADATAGLAGMPHAALVLLACDHAGLPLLLLSDLAEHSRHLAAEPRAALLLDGTAGFDAPLAGPRASLEGRLDRLAAAEAEALLPRFTRRHPEAAAYAGFADFALYRMAPVSAQLVAGFGRIRRVAAADILLDTAGAEALVDAEGGIVDHMNADHPDALGLYANRLLGRPGAGWRMTGIDPEGADLARGADRARPAFDRRVAEASAARAVLVELARRARNSGRSEPSPGNG